MSGKTNRTKGHNLERIVAAIFRNIGYDHARTTRSESKTLDDCGVDIANVPYLIQCKSGYDNHYPRYPEVYSNVKTNIGEKYPKNSIFQNMPVILIHKPTRDVTYWSFDEQSAIQLLSIQKSQGDLLEECMAILNKAKNEILSLEEALIFKEQLTEDDDILYQETVQNNQTYDEIYNLVSRLESLLNNK